MIQNPFLTLRMCFFLWRFMGKDSTFFVWSKGSWIPTWVFKLSLDPGWILKHHTSRGGFTNLFLRKIPVEPENDVLKESRKLLFQGVHFKFVHFLCAVPASKFLNTFPGSLLICHGEKPRTFLPPPKKKKTGWRICFFSSPAENWMNRKLFEQKTPKFLRPQSTHPWGPHCQGWFNA